VEHFFLFVLLGVDAACKLENTYPWIALEVTRRTTRKGRKENWVDCPFLLLSGQWAGGKGSEPGPGPNHDPPEATLEAKKIYANRHTSCPLIQRQQTNTFLDYNLVPVLTHIVIANVLFYGVKRFLERNGSLLVSLPSISRAHNAVSAIPVFRQDGTLLGWTCTKEKYRKVDVKGACA
jgi:hypothetical protein